MACPLRVVLVFFSAIVAFFLAWKAWSDDEDVVREQDIKNRDKPSSKICKIPNDSSVLSKSEDSNCEITNQSSNMFSGVGSWKLDDICCTAMNSFVLLFDMATGMYLWKLYNANHGGHNIIIDGSQRSERIS